MISSLPELAARKFKYGVGKYLCAFNKVLDIHGFVFLMGKFRLARNTAPFATVFFTARA
jgi:hypothetical protein